MGSLGRNAEAYERFTAAVDVPRTAVTAVGRGAATPEPGSLFRRCIVHRGAAPVVAMLAVVCLVIPLCSLPVEASTPTRACSLLTAADARKVLGVSVKVLTYEDTTSWCGYDGQGSAHPFISIHVMGGVAPFFDKVLRGETPLPKGFLFPGTSLRSFRRASLVIAGIRSYGEQERSIPGWRERSEYSFLGDIGDNLIAVSVLVDRNPRAVAAAGVAAVVRHVDQTGIR